MSINPDFKKMSEAQQSEFLRCSNTSEAMQLAWSPYLHRSLVRELCEYPSTEVRSIMARRRDRFASQISKLLKNDKEQDVIEGIACNPAADTRVLIYLLESRTSSYQVQSLAAENPSMPEDVADQFYVRRWVQRRN